MIKLSYEFGMDPPLPDGVLTCTEPPCDDGETNANLLLPEHASCPDLRKHKLEKREQPTNPSTTPLRT